jgi:hypothetical protein
MNQKRQSDSQPARDALPPATQARRKRPRREHDLQRWALSGVGALGFGALFVLAGCPANLENPQRFEQNDASTSTDPNVLPSCVTGLFNSTNGVCSGSVCHTGGPNAGGGLDLTSPGVVQRLLNQPATHEGVDLDAGTVMCPTVKLIDSSSPANSWLLTKVQSYTGNCGDSMPLAGAVLSSADQKCLADWVFSFSTAASGGSGGAATTSGGAPAGGAAMSGGSGGTSGGAPAGGAATSGGAPAGGAPGAGASAGGASGASAGGNGNGGSGGKSSGGSGGKSGGGSGGKSGGGSGGKSGGASAGTGGA